jgi:hypothetical protein
MNTQFLRTLVPPPVAAPWVAAWIGACAYRVVSAVWRTLQAIGQGRASRELLVMAAARADRTPALAQQLRAAGEAAKVRQLAYQRLKSDPRFAADLFAAADRHERLCMDTAGDLPTPELIIAPAARPPVARPPVAPR